MPRPGVADGMARRGGDAVGHEEENEGGGGEGGEDRGVGEQVLRREYQHQRPGGDGGLTDVVPALPFEP